MQPSKPAQQALFDVSTFYCFSLDRAMNPTKHAIKQRLIVISYHYTKRSAIYFQRLLSSVTQLVHSAFTMF